MRRMSAGPATVQAVSAAAEPIDSESYRVTLSSDRFLHSVRLEAEGYLPDDNYFYLSPQREKSLIFHAAGTARPAFRAVLRALNLDTELPIDIRLENS